MEEEFRPGDYTALGNMNIRAAMTTLVDANLKGRYFNGEPFKVYEVYQEKDGIVWGRVSSNTGGGQLRFVGLRVNNHPKAQMVSTQRMGTDERMDARMVERMDGLDERMDGIEQRMRALETRIAVLEKPAPSKSVKGTK
jgi:hypothetical protein